MEESDFYWEWLKLENTIFNNRGSLFLVAEAMLIAAVAAWASSSPLSKVVIACSGLLITLIWLLVNIKHIFGTHRVIIKGLEKDNEHPWRNAATERTSRYPWSNHYLLGICLPLILLILWVTVAFKVIG